MCGGGGLLSGARAAAGAGLAGELAQALAEVEDRRPRVQALRRAGRKVRHCEKYVCVGREKCKIAAEKYACLM